MKKILFLCGLAVLATFIAISKGGDNDPPPSTRQCTDQDAIIQLFFGNCDYPGRLQGYPCGIVPRAACDPAAFPGTTNPSSDPNKWHLRIIVDGDVNSACSTYHKEYTPITVSSGYSWIVKVPTEPYKIKVEFYEDYNSCGPSAGRPKFSYATAYAISGTHVDARLTYEGTY